MTRFPAYLLPSSLLLQCKVRLPQPQHRRTSLLFVAFVIFGNYSTDLSAPFALTRSSGRLRLWRFVPVLLLLCLRRLLSRSLTILSCCNNNREFQRCRLEQLPALPFACLPCPSCSSRPPRPARSCSLYSNHDTFTTPPLYNSFALSNPSFV